MTAFWVILGAVVVFGAGFVAGYNRAGVHAERTARANAVRKWSDS
jgi:hypothetical protein